LVHTELGTHCIGVKLNYNLVPLNHKLRSGDQVEIIASKKSFPKEEWLEYAITPRAKISIRESLKEQRKVQTAEGRIKLEEIFGELQIKFSKSNINRLSEYLKFRSTSDMFYRVSLDEITSEQIREFSLCEANENQQTNNHQDNTPQQETQTHANQNKHKSAVTYNLDDLTFSVATCCHPLPGDDIMAFSPEGANKIVHRTNCEDAIGLMTRFSKKVIHAKWENKTMDTFLGGIKISGFDRKSMISDIIRVISDEMRFNIRSFHIDTTGELFEAYISLFVHNTHDIRDTVDRLKQIEGVSSASRMIQFTKT